MSVLEKIRAEIEAVEPKSHVQYGMVWADSTLMIPFHKVMKIIDKYAKQETDINYIGEFCHKHGLVLMSKEMADKYAEQECEDDPYQTDMDEMWKQAKQEPCEDAVIREAGRCRTCKYGEVYNDLWCKCHDPLTDGIMVKMTDKCVSEEVLELNRRYKKGVGAKMGGG